LVYYVPVYEKKHLRQDLYVTKNWYKSKTIWVNVLSAIALGIQELAGGSVINPKVAVVIIVLLNTGLRLITDTAIIKR